MGEIEYCSQRCWLKRKRLPLWTSKATGRPQTDRAQRIQHQAGPGLHEGAVVVKGQDRWQPGASTHKSAPAGLNCTQLSSTKYVPEVRMNPLNWPLAEARDGGRGTAAPLEHRQQSSAAATRASAMPWRAAWHRGAWPLICGSEATYIALCILYWGGETTTG
jgi:hypothetical protein